MTKKWILIGILTVFAFTLAGCNRDQLIKKCSKNGKCDHLAIPQVKCDNVHCGEFAAGECNCL